MARKITLQEIAATTKIGTRALQALENEQFDQLPGGIFNKGFVRSYARCVGLDEEKTVAAYMAAAQVAAPETDLQALSSQMVNARDAAQSGGGGMSAASVMGVVAVLVALVLGGLWLREQRKESREAAAGKAAAAISAVVPAAPVVTAPVAPAEPVATPTDGAQPGTAGATPGEGLNTSKDAALNASQNAKQSPSQSAKQGPSQSATQGAAPVEISISATQRAWISVRSDGKPVETLTLDPDNPELRSRSYKAQDKLMVVTGNPAGLSVTYNGKPAGSLGPSGQRATITFTPEGMEKQ